MPGRRMRSGGINPQFWTSALCGSEMSASSFCHFTPREAIPSTHCIGGGVGPRSSLGVMQERKISCPCQELRFLGHPAGSPFAKPTELFFLWCKFLPPFSSGYLFPSPVYAVKCKFYRITSFGVFLYRYENLYRRLKEKHRVRVFGNRALGYNIWI
jgi:hypothetical protein